MKIELTEQETYLLIDVLRRAIFAYKYQAISIQNHSSEIFANNLYKKLLEAAE